MISMNSTMQRKTGIILTVILLAGIAAGLVSDPTNGSGLPTTQSAYLQPGLAAAAPTEGIPDDSFVETFADILDLFDRENHKYARLKTRFIENFEQISPESRNKVIQMYLGGKKEQPDKLLLMKGMSATASFLRGVEVAQNIIREYQTTGVIKEDGDFSGLASGTAILEYFPTVGKQLIPFLNTPADVTYLAEQVALVYKNSAARLAEENKVMQRINDMLEAALRK